MAFIDVKHAINICFLHCSEVLLGSREKYCGIFGHVCRQLRALLNSFNFFLFAIYISAAVCLRQPMQGKARDWWGNKKEFNVGKLYEILDLGSPGRHPVPLLSFYCNESQSCTKRRKWGRMMKTHHYQTIEHYTDLCAVWPRNLLWIYVQRSKIANLGLSHQYSTHCNVDK